MSTAQFPTNTSPAPSDKSVTGVPPPSETAPPTRVHEASQQGATAPGSGSTVQEFQTHGDMDMEVPPKTAAYVEGAHKPSFKEKVIGYAKETRGTVTRNTEEKEQGQRIVHGQDHFEPKKVGPKAP